MSRNPKLLLYDICEAINHIQKSTRDLTFEAYSSNLKRKRAVYDKFTMIGEAASRVPKEFREQFPQIEWQYLKYFREFIDHEHLELEDTVVWDIIQNELPELLQEAENILKSEF